MINQILISCLLLVSVFGSSALYAESDNSFSISMTQNAVTANYTDVVMTYQTISTAIDDNNFASVMCVSVPTESYNLLFTNYTMIAFSFEIKCDNPCSNSSALTFSEWVSYTDVIGTYSTPGADAFSTTTTVSPKYPTMANVTSDEVAFTATYTYTAQTPANIQSMGLPARGATAYYRCYGDVNYGATKAYKSATIVTLTTATFLTPGYNATLSLSTSAVVEPAEECSISGAYQAFASAILAISALTLMS